MYVFAIRFGAEKKRSFITERFWEKSVNDS